MLEADGGAAVSAGPGAITGARRVIGSIVQEVRSHVSSLAAVSQTLLPAWSAPAASALASVPIPSAPAVFQPRCSM